MPIYQTYARDGQTTFSVSVDDTVRSVTKNGSATPYTTVPGAAVLSSAAVQGDLIVITASSLGYAPKEQPLDAQLSQGSPFSASATGVLFDLDTTGFQSLAVQLSGTFVASIVYEVSNDGTNWVAITGVSSASSGNSAPSSSDGTAIVRYFQGVAERFRARVSTYTSGTVVAVPVLRAGALASLGTYIGGSTTQPTTPTASTAAPGSTSSAVKSAATTNATLVKATAGNLYDLTLSNGTASAKWFKMFDLATLPVPGTSVPKFKFMIPPGGTITMNFSTPVRFTAGIGYSITAAVADADTTATAADDVTGLFNWA